MTAGQEPEKIRGWACKGKGERLEEWSYEAWPIENDDIEIEITHCGKSLFFCLFLVILSLFKLTLMTIRIEGICHSDIHTLDSGWGEAKYPVITGHEIVGKVSKVGPKATSQFKVGDRVGVGAQCSSCHQCSDCKSSAENLCGNRIFTYNATYPNGKIAYGGYADKVRVPAPFALKVPDSLESADAAPLFCAGVTVFAPLKRHMTPGCTVGVIGIGGLGHLAIQFAKALGAHDVVAITSSESKQKDALKLGATKIVNSRDAQAMKDAAKSVDLIICTVCSHEVNWGSYISLVKNYGTFCVVGGISLHSSINYISSLDLILPLSNPPLVPEDNISLPLGSLIFPQVSLVGSIIGSPRDIQEMLDCAAKFGVKPWIEKTPMNKVNEAIARVRKNDIKFRFVLEN